MSYQGRSGNQGGTGKQASRPCMPVPMPCCRCRCQRSLPIMCFVSLVCARKPGEGKGAVCFTERVGESWYLASSVCTRCWRCWMGGKSRGERDNGRADGGVEIGEMKGIKAGVFPVFITNLPTPIISVFFFVFFLKKKKIEKRKEKRGRGITENSVWPPEAARTLTAMMVCTPSCLQTRNTFVRATNGKEKRRTADARCTTSSS